VLTVRGENITVDMRGVVLEGAAPGADPDAGEGIALRVEGGRNVRVEGRWQRGDVRLEQGSYVVRLAQPLGVLATYLIDPRSDDGLVTWNIGDRVSAGQLLSKPVRLNTPLPAACGAGAR
jgi:hypothetical protein